MLLNAMLEDDSMICAAAGDTVQCRLEGDRLELAYRCATRLIAGGMTPFGAATEIFNAA